MAKEHLIDCLKFWARRWPERMAFWCDGEELTWGEIDRRTDRFAAGLWEAGIRPGDSIGLLMRNRLEFIEVLFGAFKAGASVVLMNLRYTATEMIHPLTDAGVKLAVVEDALLPGMSKARRELPHIKVYTLDGSDATTPIEALRSSGAVPNITLDGDAIALICYTSGTTGLPKGAMQSHWALYSGSAARCLATGLNFEDRVLLPMPLAYTGGAVMLLRDGLVPGSKFYITSEVTAENMLERIESLKITMMSAVVTLFEMMMRHPKFASTDVSSLRHATTGGAVVTQHVLRTWQERGVSLTQSYGQTESAGTFMTMLFPDEAVRKVGFAGRAMPHVQIKIIDPEGRELPPNQTGEICVRSPAVMSGYMNLPEQTAAALKDGWLHTGDMGLLDEEGYLKIVDRLKDMLISGGLNVYPAEIERALASVPGLGEFAVIGIPDDRWGEVPMLVAASLDGVDLQALRARCLEELADYKRPKYFVAHQADLPRTFSGKIQKPHLREAYRSVPSRAVPLKA